MRTRSSSSLPRIAASLSIILLTQGCRSESAGFPVAVNAEGLNAISHVDLDVTPLVGSFFATIPGIGVARGMMAEGEWLWVSDRAGEPYLHLLSLRDGRVVAQVGAEGEGPGDFSTIPQFSLRPGDSGGVWAFDEVLRRMTRVSHDSPPSFVVYTLVDQPTLTFWTGWVGRSVLAQIGDMDTNRIMLVDTVGELTRMISSPLPGPDSVSIEARRNLATGFLACAEPTMGNFAVVYVGMARVELRNDAGALIGQAKVPFPTDGEFVIRKNGRWQMRHSWRYYVYCAATASHVYALFAGHEENPTIVAARHVHVFDWRGDLMGILQLDHTAGVLTVSGDTLLYAIGAESDTVWQYRLPASPSGARGQ